MRREYKKAGSRPSEEKRKMLEASKYDHQLITQNESPHIKEKNFVGPPCAHIRQNIVKLTLHSGVNKWSKQS